MTKVKSMTNSITHNLDNRIKILRFLILSLIILGVVYIYMIGSITFNVVARKSLENTIAILNSDVNKLELGYFDTVNKIDKEYAKTKGFVDVPQNIFATRVINHVAIR